jgi:hypothetical protein
MTSLWWIAAMVVAAAAAAVATFGAVRLRRATSEVRRETARLARPGPSDVFGTGRR